MAECLGMDQGRSIWLTPSSPKRRGSFKSLWQILMWRKCGLLDDIWFFHFSVFKRCIQQKKLKHFHNGWWRSYCTKMLRGAIFPLNLLQSHHLLHVESLKFCIGQKNDKYFHKKHWFFALIPQPPSSISSSAARMYSTLLQRTKTWRADVSSTRL